MMGSNSMPNASIAKASLQVPLQKLSTFNGRACWRGKPCRLCPKLSHIGLAHQSTLPSPSGRLMGPSCKMFATIWAAAAWSLLLSLSCDGDREQRRGDLDRDLSGRNPAPRSAGIAPPELSLPSLPTDTSLQPLMASQVSQSTAERLCQNATSKMQLLPASANTLVQEGHNHDHDADDDGSMLVMEMMMMINAAMRYTHTHTDRHRHRHTHTYTPTHTV
jgi:hypothetical protein